MASLLRERFQSMAQSYTSKNVMIFKVVSLGTVGGQTVFHKYALSCPCYPSQNYLYGLAVIVVPALVFFIVGVIVNQNTWDILSECRLRRKRELPEVVVFALLASVMGWATVAPMIWSVLSLLKAEAYICAMSEFVDPESIQDFPRNYSDVQGIMAGFPCQQVPVELLPFWTVIERRLKYESQVLGAVLVLFLTLLAFMTLCLKNCWASMGYHQEAYWSQFRFQERKVFRRTMQAYARIQAIRNVRSFFGFVALDKDDEELVESAADAKASIHRQEWNRITGVYLYRENLDIPLYSRLHKWANYTRQDEEKL